MVLALLFLFLLLHFLIHWVRLPLQDLPQILVRFPELLSNETLHGERLGLLIADPIIHGELFLSFILGLPILQDFCNGFLCESEELD